MLLSSERFLDRLGLGRRSDQPLMEGQMEFDLFRAILPVSEDEVLSLLSFWLWNGFRVRGTEGKLDIIAFCQLPSIESGPDEDRFLPERKPSRR